MDKEKEGTINILPFDLILLFNEKIYETTWKEKTGKDGEAEKIISNLIKLFNGKEYGYDNTDSNWGETNNRALYINIRSAKDGKICHVSIHLKPDISKKNSPKSSFHIQSDKPNHNKFNIIILEPHLHYKKNNDKYDCFFSFSRFIPEDSDKTKEDKEKNPEQYKNGFDTLPEALQKATFDEINNAFKIFSFSIEKFEELEAIHQRFKNPPAKEEKKPVVDVKQQERERKNKLIDTLISLKQGLSSENKKLLFDYIAYLKQNIDNFTEEKLIAKLREINNTNLEQKIKNDEGFIDYSIQKLFVNGKNITPSTNRLEKLRLAKQVENAKKIIFDRMNYLEKVKTFLERTNAKAEQQIKNIYGSEVKNLLLNLFDTYKKQKTQIDNLEEELRGLLKDKRRHTNHLEKETNQLKQHEKLAELIHKVLEVLNGTNNDTEVNNAFKPVYNYFNQTLKKNRKNTIMGLLDKHKSTYKNKTKGVEKATKEIKLSLMEKKAIKEKEINKAKAELRNTNSKIQKLTENPNRKGLNTLKKELNDKTPEINSLLQKYKNFTQKKKAANGKTETQNKEGTNGKNKTQKENGNK